MRWKSAYGKAKSGEGFWVAENRKIPGEIILISVISSSFWIFLSSYLLLSCWILCSIVLLCLFPPAITVYNDNGCFRPHQIHLLDVFYSLNIISLRCTFIWTASTNFIYSSSSIRYCHCRCCFCCSNEDILREDRFLDFNSFDSIRFDLMSFLRTR